MSRFNMPDDRQQQEVYNAERMVKWETYQGEIANPEYSYWGKTKYSTQEGFETLEDCWTYLNHIMNSAWFKKRYPRTYRNCASPKKTKPVRIGDGKVGSGDGGLRVVAHSGRGAYGGSREIGLTKWARQEHVLLHELAHTINFNENVGPNKYNQIHGWQFCAIYLTLIRYGMCKEARNELRQQFKNYNVKYLRPTGKNVIPGDVPERWAA